MGHKVHRKCTRGRFLATVVARRVMGGGTRSDSQSHMSWGTVEEFARIQNRNIFPEGNICYMLWQVLCVTYRKCQLAGDFGFHPKSCSSAPSTLVAALSSASTWRLLGPTLPSREFFSLYRVFYFLTTRVLLSVSCVLLTTP